MQHRSEKFLSLLCTGLPIAERHPTSHADSGQTAIPLDGSSDDMLMCGQWFSGSGTANSWWRDLQNVVFPLQWQNPLTISYLCNTTLLQREFHGYCGWKCKTHSTYIKARPEPHVYGSWPITSMHSSIELYGNNSSVGQVARMEKQK